MRLRKIIVERVTVVKFRVDNRGSNGTGCFRIKVRTDTAELTNMRIAGLRIPNQDERRVITMLWSMVSKAAERSRRQRQDNFCDPMALMR